jgi:hypothetical protein
MLGIVLAAVLIACLLLVAFAAGVNPLSGRTFDRSTLNATLRRIAGKLLRRR